MRKLITEIHRRGLFSTAALYLAAAWITLQVGTTLTPILGFPDWTPQALLLVLMGLAGYWERHGPPRLLAQHSLGAPAPSGAL